MAPTDDDRFSRITIVVDVESAPLEQIVKQLDKLINVVKIDELAPGDAVERELLLATVSAPAESRGQVIELVGVFEGKVLSVGHDELTVSLEGSPRKLDDFTELLGTYGIAAVQRTGRVALPTHRAPQRGAFRRPRRVRTSPGSLSPIRPTPPGVDPPRFTLRQEHLPWPPCTTRRTPTDRSSPTARWP